MAWFVVPAAEAVGVAVAAKHKSEKPGKISFAKKLGWLRNLLVGGSVLLAFEHVWHGELAPFFPFLTRAANPADAGEMLHEMATAGVGMAALVTAVWCGMLVVSKVMERRHSEVRA